jgi:glycerophosphoryl diester phosphodiesterase
LELVQGRVPLLIEIKSEWDAPDERFLKAIAATALGYRGPIALMSFDPAVMAAIRELAPAIPRGIVSGPFLADCWWRDQLGPERAYSLTHLLESGPVAPDFFAYDVTALPTPVTRFAREVLGLPLFTWTVRTEEQRATAARWADAPIFEGYEP